MKTGKAKYQLLLKTAKFMENALMGLEKLLSKMEILMRVTFLMDF